ncbi:MULTISPECIES: ABC transporter permease subunit [Pandoraea]|uniref:ABC transporter permease n=1 Tax=Pandoraea TaxID=93217 RepID=UPI001F5C25BB|nr:MULTISPECIES: ABC transporter permease subunit [Pandoraea]
MSAILDNAALRGASPAGALELTEHTEGSALRATASAVSTTSSHLPVFDDTDIDQLFAAPRAPALWGAGFAAALAWAAFGSLTLRWPNKIVGFADWAFTDELGVFALVVAALLAVLSVAGRATPPLLRLREALTGAGPWLVAIPVALSAWEILTAKTGALPTPFFAPPQALIEVYTEDWRRLGDSAVNTLKLLGLGFGFGAIAGFLIGVSIGWSRAIGYWVHPVLRVLGPVPATALLPLTFYFFPSSYSAAAFLIALSTAFPVAVLTWSGVAGVNKSYYDVARTLGASEAFLVLRVAIPAALPNVFVGLFMGLGASFSVLVTAEMMGVKSGLGWYLTWAQGWASYVNMYAALIVMALLFSGVITLLFTVRDRALAWQKGTVKW